jgi:hypothetical protein
MTREGTALSEQPSDTTPQAPDESTRDTAAGPESTPRRNVRTEGETNVDNALGAADDPA